MLVVQVDDYLFRGTTEISSGFELLFQVQFHIGWTESCKFDIMGAHLFLDESGVITLEVKDRFKEVQEIEQDCIGQTK